VKYRHVDHDAELSEEEFRLLRDFVHERFGLYYDESQRASLRARLSPRLDLLGLSSFEDYHRYLRFAPERADEQQRMVIHLTNNETYFFRETRQFTALFQQGLNELESNGSKLRSLRCLSAGCSSGEEPYTLSIFAQQYAHLLAGARLEIHAFDIDTDRLDSALKAIYGPSSLRALDADDIRRYFTERDIHRWELQAGYRETVRFRVGNIMDLRSFRRPQPYDVLFCRNALIYFSEEALHRAIDNFAQVLRPGGLLFLGHAESIIGVSRQFETVRLGNCIAYRRVLASGS
jgi:chemotaxis protein methyltransferase CheR